MWLLNERDEEPIEEPIRDAQVGADPVSEVRVEYWEGGTHVGKAQVFPPEYLFKMLRRDSVIFDEDLVGLCLHDHVALGTQVDIGR